VEARDRIGALRASASHSAKIIKRVELRRESARLLFDSIRGDSEAKP